jgi:alkanesulfonate monooxygenase SsuD/methylene tetrahydromethanopterin reductase-like flavin-dependent oxidoreductase (luciferase family)
MTAGAGDGGPVQVFVDLTRFAATATRTQLRDRVRELDDVGATGVSVSDHIFFTSGGRPRSDGVGHGCDPLTTLAAVAGLSDRLAVQTVVMNSAWVHPGLLLHQFAQLAVLVGGGRVTAGLGAGWSAEEFDALGLAMPKFRTRIDRLAEVLAVARSLWTEETVTYDGDHVVARDLPMSPVPDRPPRLLVGGGSDRLLGLAGRFADLLDLHGDPKHGRVAGATMAQASAGDVARRAHTTVDDLAGRIGLVRDAAEAAGRPRDAVGVATQIWYAAFGSPAEVRAAEEELCERWTGIPYRPLHRSPYLLFGSPAQMAEALAERREAYGLQRISLSEESGIAAAPPDPLRFCREVLPLLD